jgi:hypothetical protein
MIAALAVIAAASGYLFLNYDRLIEAASATHPAAASSEDKAEPTVSLKDFQSFEQQLKGTLESTRQDIAVQQSDMKSLLDRVAALSAKVDELKSMPRPAQPQVTERPVTERPVAPAARKKPPARKPPKPAGAISVGGAPLPTSRN